MGALFRRRKRIAYAGQIVANHEVERDFRRILEEKAPLGADARKEWMDYWRRTGDSFLTLAKGDAGQLSGDLRASPYDSPVTEADENRVGWRSGAEVMRPIPLWSCRGRE